MFNTLGCKEGLILKLGQLIKCYIRKMWWKCALKNSPNIQFWYLKQNIGNVFKNSFATKIFWNGNVKNPHFYFQLYYEKQKRPGTNCRSLFRLPNMFSFFSNSSPGQFWCLIQNRFFSYSKNHSNSCKPYNDILVVLFSTLS